MHLGPSCPPSNHGQWSKLKITHTPPGKYMTDFNRRFMVFSAQAWRNLVLMMEPFLGGSHCMHTTHAYAQILRCQGKPVSNKPQSNVALVSATEMQMRQPVKRMCGAQLTFILSMRNFYLHGTVVRSTVACKHAMPLCGERCKNKVVPWLECGQPCVVRSVAFITHGAE